jgi:PBSX family phage terminase large subunit
MEQVNKMDIKTETLEKKLKTLGKKYKKKAISPDSHKTGFEKSKKGRPSTISDEVKQKIEFAYSIGAKQEEVCLYAGIGRTTLWRILSKDDAFAERLEILKHRPVLKARFNIVKAMEGDPQNGIPPDISTTRWFLERIKRKEFGSDLFLIKMMEASGELKPENLQGQATVGYSGIPLELIGSGFADFFRQVRRHDYTHFREPGGRGAGRSSAISLAIIDLIMNNPTIHALACRQVGNTIRDSVYSQLIWAINELGLSEQFKCNKSIFLITRIETGQHIFFRGLDEPFKIKSIKPPFGYIGIFWVEEADQTKGDDQLRNVRQSIMRGGEKFWIFESWNTPRNKQHWINVRTDEDRERDDIRTHHSTYLNMPKEWLGQPFIDEALALKAKNEKAYLHEYMGEAIGYGGDVFENISLETISNDSIAAFDNIKRGIDWGFSTDPLAFVKCHFDSTRRILYIFDELVATKLTDNETAKLLNERGITSNDLIIADCEDPKSIENFKRMRFFINGCHKYAGSVDHGVKFMQDLEMIVIDPKRCPVAAYEFANYALKQDKDGQFLPIIVRENDHTIDAVRYALDNEINKNGTTKVQYTSSR